MSSYIEVAARLREGVLSQAYPPGSRLPSEREVAEKLGVSRVTVRRALRVLEQERLVQRRQGSGTYVSPEPSRRIPLMIDYTGSMRDHAPALKRHLRLWRREPAGPIAAEALEIDEDGEILYVERADEIDGSVVAWDRAFIVPSFASRLRESDLAHVDFVETWTRRERFSVERCRQTVEAVVADSEISRELGLTRGRPVLKSTEVYLTLNSRPAGLFISCYDPARICITSDYRWAEATAGGRKTRKAGL